MANPTSANDTEHDRKGKAERDLGRRAYSCSSGAHVEGYIHNTLVKLRLQTQSLIIKKKTPCIVTINSLCNVHVMTTQIPPSSILNLFSSWGPFVQPSNVSNAD